MQIIYSPTKYHQLALEFPYDENVVTKCRELQSEIGWQAFSFNREIKAWSFNPIDLDKLKYTFPQAKVTAPAQNCHTLWQASVALEQERKMEAQTEVEVEGLPLFQYQKKGVAFGSTYEKIMIADEMGLGKSIQALGVIKNLRLEKKNVLIVCPASLKSNWQNEAWKWGISSRVLLKMEAKTIFENLTFDSLCIINYEQLNNLADQEWDLIIFDESHYLKNGKAKRTKEAKRIAAKAKRVIMLTGTPILNRPVELVSQIEILGQMEHFKSSWNFMQRYCGAKQNNWGWDFSGASNLDELKSLLNAFVIRRTKKEVLPDLPDKLVHSTFLDMPEPEAYKKVQKEAQNELVSTKEEYKEFYKMLGGMTELQRANYLDGLQHNERFRQLNSSILTTIEKLKQEAARQKLLLLPEILEQYGDEKVLMFGTHKAVVNEFANKAGCLWMTGDLAVEDRMVKVDQFQNDPKQQFLIGTIATMGVGFNITAASNVIFLELGWTPALHQQAEDRCYRIGQKNNVNINYLILKDSIDEDIAELLMNKAEVVEGTIKGKVLAKILQKNLTF